MKCVFIPFILSMHDLDKSIALFIGCFTDIIFQILESFCANSGNTVLVSTMNRMYVSLSASTFQLCEKCTPFDRTAVMFGRISFMFVCIVI